MKSLNLKLEDIKLVIENPLYVKPIIINIRISQLRTNIKEMICAINFLGNRLEETQWPEVEIDDYFIFEKMKENFYELGKTQEIICNQKDISIEESKEFVHMYIKWCKKSGFNVTDEHIKLIASSKYISLDQTIKQIFKNYFL
ncbi:hypothetical protein P0E51_13510 [Enterococcus faecalis]|uniref:hypothetical protein n=1 Tax=Enterococcus faecalis TaxID=1351 RepID=UPI0025B21F92|nr:hypothetical protein [Enterococcus faecalis]MDN3077099.1 hypothetical protein [Enterococcus faecalis]